MPVAEPQVVQIPVGLISCEPYPAPIQTLSERKTIRNVRGEEAVPHPSRGRSPQTGIQIRLDALRYHAKI
jgi:hypothetical protein